MAGKEVVHRNHMTQFNLFDELVQSYPLLRLAPSIDKNMIITGTLDFRAVNGDQPVISESFDIEIVVPSQFPLQLPVVTELSGEIEQAQYHVNSDKSLCLGNPLRLKHLMGNNSTLLQFVNRCIVPFFYNYQLFKRNGSTDIGGLKHGARGLLDDCNEIFSIHDDEACIRFLEILGMKKRQGNKLLCPCGSGVRLGRCHPNWPIRFRALASRKYYRRFLKILLTQRTLDL